MPLREPIKSTRASKSTFLQMTAVRAGHRDPDVLCPSDWRSRTAKMVPSMFVIESPRKEVNLWRKCEKMGSLACTARSSSVWMSDRGKHRVVQQDEECDDDEHIDVWRAARNSRIGLASWR